MTGTQGRAVVYQRPPEPEPGREPAELWAIVRRSFEEPADGPAESSLSMCKGVADNLVQEWHLTPR